jgi:hypothetical protein
MSWRVDIAGESDGGVKFDVATSRPLAVTESVWSIPHVPEVVASEK